MSTSAPPAEPLKHFTPFRSAAEELAMEDGENNWINKGGHMNSAYGLVVSTPGNDLPYKVILTCHGGEDSERPFATMRQAEAFIRHNTPVPTARRTLYDRPAEAGLSSASSREVTP